MSVSKTCARRPRSPGLLHLLRVTARGLIGRGLRRLHARLAPGWGSEPALVPVPIRSGVIRRPNS